MITIYCHIHRASGRRYVGQTRYSMEKRWRQHIYNAIRGDCRVFAAAILEYGPDAASAIASKLATLTPEQRVVLLSTVPDVERMAS